MELSKRECMVEPGADPIPDFETLREHLETLETMYRSDAPESEVIDHYYTMHWELAHLAAIVAYGRKIA